jgi:CRP-like cAMP-binding protein
MNANLFIHAANVLLLLAYSVKDILWLRLFAIASALVAIPYFVFQPTPQWAPIAWSVLFAGINSFQSWRLYLERRPVKLTAEEEEVRRLAFPDLPPRKVLELLSIGSWSTAEPGERMIESGKRADAMSLIVRGKVEVTKEGTVLSELQAGDFVGSALLLSGTVSDVDAVAVEPVRNVKWIARTLERYLDANPDTRTALQRHLSRDLAGKVWHLTSDARQLSQRH